jgi:hypothetical protein
VITVSLSGSAQSYSVTNPIAIAPSASLWRVLDPSSLTILIVILMVGGMVSLAVRYRRAAGIERQQLRWVVAAIAFLVVAIPGGFVLSLLIPSSGNAGSGLAWIGAIIGYPLIPIAIGIAVLRYRLYEIDRIISRTISYGVLTAIISGLFVACIFLFQEVLAPLTQSNTLAVAGATLLVFSVFQPLRRRVQARVEQRFNRARYDGDRTLALFAGRMRDEVDLGRLATEIAATVARTVEPASVSLWLRD